MYVNEFCSLLNQAARWLDYLTVEELNDPDVAKWLQEMGEGCRELLEQIKARNVLTDRRSRFPARQLPPGTAWPVVFSAGRVRWLIHQAHCAVARLPGTREIEVHLPFRVPHALPVDHGDGIDLFDDE
jgi:hypothetical protein